MDGDLSFSDAMTLAAEKPKNGMSRNWQATP